MRLGADERDLPLVIRVAKARRDRVAGRAGADDYGLRSRSRSLRSDQTRYPPSTAAANA
jgi:hypothetical protein